MMILAEIGRGGGAVGEIAERVGLNEGLVESVLFLLVSQRLVERKQRPAAPASPLYQITRDGVRLLDATGGSERPWDEES